MHGENRVISACISAKQLDNFGTLWRSLGLCQWMMVLSSVEKVCVTWGATFWPPLHEFASQNRRTLHKFMRRGKELRGTVETRQRRDELLVYAMASSFGEIRCGIWRREFRFWSRAPNRAQVAASRPDASKARRTE